MYTHGPWMSISAYPDPPRSRRENLDRFMPLLFQDAHEFFFPQHLVEGLLNVRRRVCRSFWLDLAFQDTPGKRTNNIIVFCCPPNEIKPSSA